MAARTAHKSELNRALAIFDARGERLTAIDVMPGGVYRLHCGQPEGTPEELVETPEEARAWADKLAS